MSANLVKVIVDSTEIDALSAKVNDIEATLLRCVELSRQVAVQISPEGSFVSEQSVSKHPKPSDMSIYQGDDYPRDGCTLVVCFEHKGWSLREYAPGFIPVGPQGWIASYMPRPLGSLGLALDAYASGKTIKSVLPEMVKAERAYALASGSSVTL